MADEIRPALTPEEWARGYGADTHFGFERDGKLYNPADGQTVTDPLGEMALCNAALPDGHPNKLTAADVTALRVAAGEAGVRAMHHMGPKGNPEKRREHEDAEQALHRIANKLAALLQTNDI